MLRPAGGYALYWAILLFSGIAFGSSFSLFKVAAGSGQEPLGLAFWYSGLSAVLVLGPFLAGKCWRWLNGRVIVFCILWGLLSTAMPSVFFFFATRELPAGIVALAIALVPMATFAGAVLLQRDRAGLRRCIGLGLGIVAALLVLLPETSLPEPEDVLWLLFPFGAVLCYAAEHLYYSIRVPEKIPVAGLLFVMFSCTALMLMPVSLMTSGFFLPGWPPGREDWALLGLALVTVLDYFLFAFLITRTGPVFTSQAAYVVTLAGVGWGVLLFSERHSPWVWLALVLSLAGIFLVRPKGDAA